MEHPVTALVACHRGLMNTRGVVLTLAWIDGEHDRMTWLAVGNVQNVLLHRNGGPGPHAEALVGQGGVVGRRLPPPHTRVVAITPGDLLVLATDGIHPGFTREVPHMDRPRQVADLILDRHRTGTDDALVLAVRYRGAFS
jgi:negative regulator of sigma-B (phosphoserine phosphatase)